MDFRNNSKLFLKTYEPRFSYKYVQDKSRIMFIENKNILLKVKKIVDTLNSYLDSEADLLDLFNWPYVPVDPIKDNIKNKISRFIRIIRKIKHKFKVSTKF